MKEYSTYGPGDFALDEDFVKWVKYPGLNPALDNFWENWLQENGDKGEVVEEARHIVLAVVGEDQYLVDDLKKEQIWNRICDSIKPVPMLEPRADLWRHWYSKAAAILIAAGIGWLTWNSGNVMNDDLSLPAYLNGGGDEYIEQINNSDVQRTIILSDGTSIVLQPHSILEYPRIFGPDRREISLKGEAFFEVTKDANRPFLVYANELVTRVLGTSFKVRNYTEEENVLVQVKSGKVSVFRKKNRNTPFNRKEKSIEGVILMPNQQVLYQRKAMKMTKGLVDNPSIIVPLNGHKFEFTDAPIREVFEAIEVAYGVDIVYDEEVLSTCYLNASLSGVPLYDKLKLICKGINTTYEVIDSHIVIYGKGCSEN